MNSKLIWSLWLLMTLAIGSYYAYSIFGGGDKTQLLIGESTYGHFQIEMACETCHSDPFGGPEVLQDACTKCHAEELKAALDSHPKNKFTDPRNANLLKIIDARYCISCHTEHQQEQTRAMGVTLPDDYCFHCHEELGDERPSHEGLPFDSCASAGCHNFHDNRALYEDFLVKHANQPWLLTKEHPPFINLNLPSVSAKIQKLAALSIEDIDATNMLNDKNYIAQDWLADKHSQAGINCSGCHNSSDNWIDKPDHHICAECHTLETKGFLSGKHGMRLAENLSQSLAPIKPRESNLNFQDDAANKQQKCTACHAAHTFDTSFAATEACLSCHNDEHSLAFEFSPHAQLENNNFAAENSRVTCATCHMPRELSEQHDKKLLFVQHNQNYNLRPNEKMIRSVCMNCHGLEFAINSLADPELIRNNFNGRPTKHVESIDWALKRIKEN